MKNTDFSFLNFPPSSHFGGYTQCRPLLLSVILDFFVEISQILRAKRPAN